MRLFNVAATLIGVTACVGAAVVPTSTRTDLIAGVQALVRRRLPEHAESFEFTLLGVVSESSERVAQKVLGKGDGDSYIVSSTGNGKIHIQGNTPSALLSGLHTYLSEIAHVDIWWYIGSQLDQADRELPKLSAPLMGSSIVPYRYHFNTVTTSYTSAFWSWEDWELQLDWMALRGVNLALAWIGVEKIFIDVFHGIGLTDAEIATFLSGPAFLAWNHFGNIQGSWGGDLPYSWVDSQFELQKKILGRMIELGMTPILPAFPGYVPRAITRVFPNVTVSNGSTWERFPITYTGDTFIDPFDPVFEQLQKSFIARQRELYGNITTLYTLDQFNENNPPSGELDYLRNISSNTWKTLKAAGEDIVWVMQGWLFASNSAFWTNERIKAFMDGVPENNDMLIIDLVSESLPQWQRTNSYYGKPWLWCELHDYGGNMGLYGQVDNITINAVQAVAESNSLVGFGLSMEGQEGNEIVYDLLLSQAWNKKPIDSKVYFHDWVAARYSLRSHGSEDKYLYDAWETLRTTVFNNTHLAANAVPKSILELVPSTSGLINRTGHHPTILNYRPSSMVEGWKQLHQASSDDKSLFSNPSYQYDLVDWSRQVLANAFIPMYEQLVSIYTGTKSSKCRAAGLKKQGKKISKLLTSLDAILSTNENFRLSTWLKSARSAAGDNSTLADFFEYEARNQITLWGPDGEISDYASKSWSGLVASYYLPRWEMFVKYLINTEPAAYNQTEFATVLLKWERKWVNQTSDGLSKDTATEKIEAVLPAVLKDWPEIFS